MGVALWAAAAIVAIGYAVVPTGAGEPAGRLEAPVEPRLPDLAMVPVEVCCIGVADDGTWTLRFGATIVNVGEGDFVVRAQRRSRLGPWTLQQHIADGASGYTVSDAQGADLIWGGDGHQHWHVARIETHWIETLDGSEVIGSVIKPGFCFFDTTEIDLGLPEAPGAPAWLEPACGTRLDTSLRMGLSVGWGDTYAWHLFDQNIDVTGLAPGRYRIRAVADPEDWFDELDERNNETWTIIDVALDADGLPVVTVVEEAPAP